MNKKERLELALKAITGQQKSDLPSNNEVLGEILVPNFMSKTPYAESLVINLADGLDAARVKYTDDGYLGGLEAQWLEEGETIDLQKTSFKSKRVELGKLGIVIPITNELDQDVPTLVQYLSKMISRAIRNKVNAAMLYGSPKMDGILSTNKKATYFVDTGTHTGIKSQVNEMYKRYYGAEQGLWIFSKDKYIELVDEYESDLAFSAENPFGQLWGLPIYVAPYMRSGQVVLGDFNHYVIAQKEMKSAISDSIYFLSDEQALKITLRIGGKVPYEKGWVNADYAFIEGEESSEDELGYVVYPFVALDSMEMSSSSESSSSSSESSEDESETSSDSE